MKRPEASVFSWIETVVLTNIILLSYMQFIKKILLSWLGEKKYLSLLAGTFQSLYKKINMGRSYQDIYFLRKLVSPGDYCADIGAHLGYYTFELSALAGKDGKIIAVEPMSKFNQTLKNLLKKKIAK